MLKGSESKSYMQECHLHEWQIIQFKSKKTCVLKTRYPWYRNSTAPAIVRMIVVIYGNTKNETEVVTIIDAERP